MDLLDNLLAVERVVSIVFLIRSVIKIDGERQRACIRNLGFFCARRHAPFLRLLTTAPPESRPNPGRVTRLRHAEGQ